jgi:hypothetical protein
MRILPEGGGRGGGRHLGGGFEDEVEGLTQKEGWG